jgi:hypothetical protein
MNPIVAGWMQYYGRFYRTELHPLLLRINTYLMRWARAKYRRLHGFKKAKAWWDAVCDRYPADSPNGNGPEDSCRHDWKSRVTGDCHARFRGSRRVRFPPATRQHQRPPHDRVNDLARSRVLDSFG